MLSPNILKVLFSH